MPKDEVAPYTLDEFDRTLAELESNCVRRPRSPSPKLLRTAPLSAI
jgi:hypothetical protein